MPIPSLIVFYYPLACKLVRMLTAFALSKQQGMVVDVVVVFPQRTLSTWGMSNMIHPTHQKSISIHQPATTTGWVHGNDTS